MVVVASPTPSHKQVLSQILDYYEETLLVSEKPLSASLDDCEHLFERASERGTHLVVVSTVGFEPYVREARDWLLASQKFPTGVSYVHSMAQPFGEEDGSTWRSRVKNAGGVVFDLGYHAIEALEHTLGSSISAFVSGSVTRNGFGVGETAQGLFRHENGVHSTAFVSWASPTPTRHIRIETLGHSPLFQPYSRRWASPLAGARHVGKEVSLPFVEFYRSLMHLFPSGEVTKVAQNSERERVLHLTGILSSWVSV
jgi:predicted dehydrogenase